MSNKPFSYEEAAQPADTNQATGFSYEDATGTTPAKGFGGHLKDAALSAAKGIIAVPEAAVGLADIATGGRVGKFLENDGGAIGFRPKQAKEYLSDFHTDAYKAQQKQFQEADGIVDKTIVALQNPSLITNSVVESAPGMLAGGVAARGLMGVGAKTVGTAAGGVGPALPGTLARIAGEKAAPIIAGATGEGLTMAGQNAEGIRQETADGLLDAKQAAAATAIGVAGAGLGMFGGKVAQKLGIGDIETMVANGSLANMSAKSIPRQVIEGAISEGFLEELPQSAAEQVLQNLALNKPWNDGLDDALVMGTLAGMAMGGGANAVSGVFGKESKKDGGVATAAQPGQPVKPDPIKPLGLGFNPNAGTHTVFPDGSVILNSDTQAGEQAVFDRRYAPQKAATPEQKASRLVELEQITQGTSDQTITTPDGQQVVIPGKPPRYFTEQERAEYQALKREFEPTPAKPSAAIGLQPGTGSLTDAAIIAVDSGVSQTPASAAEFPAAPFKDATAQDQATYQSSGFPAFDPTKTKQAVTDRRRVAIENLLERDPGAAVQSQDPYDIPPFGEANDAADGPSQDMGNGGELSNVQPGPEVEGNAVQSDAPANADGPQRAGRFDALNGQAPTAKATTGQKLKSLKDFMAKKKAEREAANVQNTAPGAAGVPAAGNSSVEANGVDQKATKAELDRLTIPEMTDGQLQAAVSVYGPEHKRTAKVQKEIERRKASATPATEPTTTEPTNGTQATQAQQAETQGQQAPAADAAVTEPPDAGQDETGANWNRMTTVEREAVALRTGIKGVAAKNVATRGWQGLDRVVRERLAKVMANPVANATAQSLRRGTVGMTLAAGEVVTDQFGNATTPFPKIDTSTNRKAENTLRAVNRWLVDNALAAAQKRGDQFNERQFQAINLLNISQADKDSAEQYLFGDQAPAVVPSILKPLVPTNASAPAPAPEPTETVDQKVARKAAEAAAAKAVAEEAKRAGAEIENELFRELGSMSSLVGKTTEEIAAEVNQRLDARNQDAAVQTIKRTKLIRAIVAELKKNATELAKAKHRDPATLAAAMQAAMPEGMTEPEHIAAFNAGFMHALAGKTKSTLSGDFLLRMTIGYDAAQDWIETEEGKAYYEGRPVNKLQNTGVDLRRHWELMKAQMKADESDVKKAWAQIERATTRADLFAPLLPDGVSPGMTKYVTEFRGHVMPFKKWLEDKYADWYGSVAYRSRYSGSKQTNLDYILEGSRYPNTLSKEDRQKFETDDAYRIQWLQGAAAEYLQKVQALTDFMQGVSSVAEAAQRFDERYIDPQKLAANPAGITRYASGSVLNDAAHAARQGVWDGDAFDFSQFRSTSSWTAEIAANEATIKLPDRAQPLTPPKLDRVTREGLPDQRKGNNITPAEFKTMFGMADVGFGTWVGAKQDQDHLNYAHDAFMDLANHFGTEPKNLGFGGQMHFTIGALGHGKFAAHFQPAHPGPKGPVPVINLTNTKGDGTVYHEWIHALDHFLGGDWRSGVRTKFLSLLKYEPQTTEHYERVAKKFLVGGFYWKNDKRQNKQDAAIYAMGRYSNPSQGATTTYKSNADALGKDYWGNDEELIARASEAWAVDTLKGTNTYLVNPAWAGDGAVTADKGFRGTPYPTGAERQFFAQVFQALVKSIKWVDGKPTVAREDFNKALPQGLRDGEARRLELATPAGMKAYADKLAGEIAEAKAIKDQASNEAKRAEQEEMDRIAAEKLAELQASLPPVDPPKPDQTMGALSDDDLSAIFDQAAAELREENQEKPDVPQPGLGEDSLPPLTKADGVPDAADAQELYNLVASGQRVLLAGTRWAARMGLPNIQMFTNLSSDGQGRVDHMGFGVFRFSGRDFAGTWSAGGSMQETKGGISYTTFSLDRGEWEYPKARVLEALTKVGAVAPGVTTKAPAAQDTSTGSRTTSTPSTYQGKPESAADKKASQLLAEAAKLGVKGADEALKGLAKLFGGRPGQLNSFPAGFDEETYNAAKPHFKAALTAFQEAGKTLKDLFKMLIGQFGDGIKDYAIQFAKDEGLTAQLSAAPAADAPRSPSMLLADYVANQLREGRAFDWRVLFAQADAYFGGTQAEGKYTPKDAYDAMEAGMNLWLMRDGGRHLNPNTDAQGAQLAVASLERALALLPTQSKRTAEQDEFQQFSTVPPLAYMANWVANITSADTMMEPSGGVGGLAAFAKNAGARLILNELSQRRAALLRDLFPSTKIYTENAEQLHNILPDGVVPSVVVMNPPFSASAGRVQGRRDTQIGGQHVEQALLRLAPGGRLVAIVGEGMAMDRQAFKDWWAKIGAKYDVRAVIPMDGSGYAKYGTTFDNVMLVIDKVKPSGRDVVTTQVKTYTELVGLLQEIRNDRPQSTIPSNDADGLERDASESARSDAVPAGQGDVQPEQSGAGELDAVGGGEPLPGLAPGATGGGRSGGGTGGRSTSTARQPRGRTDAGGADAAGSSGRASEPGSGDVSGVTVQASVTQAAGELTDSVFESYQPQRLQVPGAKAHPGPLVQSAAMASVLPPAPTYTPSLPKETVSKGLLSIAQIESVVYAGQAHSEFLEPRTEKGSTTPVQYRRGFFIGDGTGVGKGREISGILLDNMRQGRKKHVWVSEKQGLMHDAKRDYKGVGGDDSVIFNQNKTKAEDSITAPDGILFTTYSTLRSGAQSQPTGTGKPVTNAQYEKAFPKGSPVVTARGDKTYYVQSFDVKNRRINVSLEPDANNYAGFLRFGVVESIAGRTDFNDSDAVRAIIESQKAAGKGKKAAAQSRLDQLVKWLGEDFDGVIAFDEAHNAGNAIAIKGARGTSEPSAQALAVVELQKRLPKARVVYVSATGATEVSNLSFATRIGLWGPGTPFPGVEGFIAEMNAGGLSAMELVARDMKQMGGYIARSLSFDGVSYSRVEHELTPLQHDIYNRMAEAWQVTLQNFNEALKITGATDDKGKGSSKAKSAARSAYWGAQQRFFNQIITSMQMPSVIEQMERDLANGDALVLQLVNTNEAQQDRAVAKRKEDGESGDLEDLDLTPRDQLIQLVEKSFPVVQYEEVSDSEGKITREVVKDSNGMPVVNKQAEGMRDKLIEDLKQIKVPDGPLEIVLNHFGVERVAEVTGRSQRVVRLPDGKGDVKATLESRGSSAARADADAFMADKKPILVFSDAGGTGFSFHADLTKPNQRKRKHYLIQPGWRADKAVQGFGRTHRTNQKSAPHYYLASTNIPAQKRFLSAIARRLDQLGALTKGQRDTANQGMFSEKDNLESKYATQAVRQFFEDARRGLMQGIDFQEFLRQTGLEDILDEQGQIAESKMPTTRLFLNRMLSLSLPMQDKVFNVFIQLMEEKVDVAIQRGELDTGMQTIRAKESRVVSDDVAYTDPRTGAETRLVELELTHPTVIHSFPADEKGAEYLVNNKSGRVWVKLPRGQTTLKDGAVVDKFSLRGTSGAQMKDATEFHPGLGHYRKIDRDDAMDMWGQENAKRPPTYTEQAYMVVGAMLPIWDRLKSAGSIKVARTQTVDGQRLLGMVIPRNEVAEIRKRLNITSGASKLAVPEVMARILKGDVAELANGWKLERARVSNDLRIELKAGYLGRSAQDELRGYGVIVERINWNERFFVPVGPAGVEAMSKMLKSKPVVELSNPSDAGDGAVFSQGLLSTNSLGPKPTPEQVQRLVDKIQKIAKNVIPVTVIGSPSQIPGVYVPAGSKPTGALIRGQIYLFTDNIKSIGDAYVTLFHEVFHLGLQNVIPAEDYAAMLRKFSRNVLVQNFVRKWKSSPEGIERAAAMPSAAYEMLAAEEALAMISEDLASNDGIGSRNMPGLVKALLSWLASVADRLGLPGDFGSWIRGLTRTDAEKFVNDMTRAAMGGNKNLAKTRAKYGTLSKELSQPMRLRQDQSEREIADLFEGLQQPRGLKLTQALRRIDAHPMAETIKAVDRNFMDILGRLDDAGLVDINC